MISFSSILSANQVVSENIKNISEIAGHVEQRLLVHELKKGGLSQSSEIVFFGVLYLS